MGYNYSGTYKGKVDIVFLEGGKVQKEIAETKVTILKICENVYKYYQYSKIINTGQIVENNGIGQKSINNKGLVFSVLNNAGSIDSQFTVYPSSIHNNRVKKLKIQHTFTDVTPITCGIATAYVKKINSN